MSVPWIILFVLLWVVVVALVVLVLGLTRRITLIEASPQVEPTSESLDLFADTPAIGAQLPDVDDRLLAPLPERGNTALLFLSSSCGPCAALADKLLADITPSGSSPGIVSDDDEIVVVTDPDGASRFGPVGRVVVESAKEITDVLGVKGTPVGFGVDKNGIVKLTTILTGTNDVMRLIDACAPQAHAVGVAG